VVLGGGRRQISVRKQSNLQWGCRRVGDGSGPRRERLTVNDAPTFFFALLPFFLGLLGSCPYVAMDSKVCAYTHSIQHDNN
jgi:hypothetical protein